MEGDAGAEGRVWLIVDAGSGGGGGGGGAVRVPGRRVGVPGGPGARAAGKGVRARDPDAGDGDGPGADADADPWASPPWVDAVVFAGWAFALFVLVYCVSCVPLAEALGAAEGAQAAIARARAAAAGPMRSAAGIYEGASRLAAALSEALPAASTFRARLDRWMSDGSAHVGWLSASALRAARATADFVSDERPLRYRFSLSPDP